jgi:hypothetical protein
MQSFVALVSLCVLTVLVTLLLRDVPFKETQDESPAGIEMAEAV